MTTHTFDFVTNGEHQILEVFANSQESLRFFEANPNAVKVDSIMAVTVVDAARVALQRRGMSLIPGSTWHKVLSWLDSND
jgi:hypothetical protein